MNRITKAWTYGVAYLSLAVGSGVSIAGNIADTYRVAETAGRQVDTLDIVISAFWPAAVLLAIEMFVSHLWPRTVAMQAVRWLGSLGIGFVAMYVSWHHLADLLSSRGQDSVVSWLGPLAIDGLAIMATGLILSSRGHKLDVVVTEADHLYIPEAPIATQPMSPEWTDEDAAMLVQWEKDMDRLENEAYAPVVPVSPAPALARSNEVKPESVPAAALDYFRAWDEAPKTERPTKKDMNALVAATYKVSERTARRWYDATKTNV